MKKTLLVVVFVLAFTSLASAQSITSWSLKTFNAGASAPLSTTVLQAVNVVCNQVAPLPSSYTQPTKVIFDDPANVGKVCIWTDPGTGPLFSVPFGGSYEATLAATNIAGTSADSARAPFTRAGSVPTAPANLRIGG